MFDLIASVFRFFSGGESPADERLARRRARSIEVAALIKAERSTASSDLASRALIARSEQSARDRAASDLTRLRERDNDLDL